MKIHSYQKIKPALDLARVEKGDVILDYTAPKRYLLLFGDQTVKVGHITSKKVSSHAS